MPHKNKEEKRKKQREYNLKNKDKISKQRKEYREKNKDRIRAKAKEFRQKNKEKIKQDKQKYYQNNKEKIKEYKERNKERTKLQRRKYHVEYEKERKKIDPTYKAVKLTRRRIGHAIKRLNLKKDKKIGAFEKRFGCTKESFKRHIEDQFTSVMSWDNWGKYWQLDHIIPLSCAKTFDEVLMLNHYTNLRPLLSKENTMKADTLPDHFPDNFPYWNHFLHVFEA